MPTLSEALAIAVAHHQAGRLQAAEAIYRQILQADPQSADAWHFLGILAHQAGNFQTAVDHIGRALQLRPDFATFHSNLALCHQSLGNANEAIACWRRAVALEPDFADAHYRLGMALKNQGKAEEARECCRRAVQLKPNFPEAQLVLGNLLLDSGQTAEAIACYQRALQSRPDYVQAHNNWGFALQRQGRLDEAVTCYRRALQGDPDYAEAHNNLGNALAEQKRLPEAAACYRRALELRPDYADAYNNLAGALRAEGKLDEALACYGRALELRPDYVEALSNQCATLKDQGRLDEAVACGRRALELQPACVEAHTNLGCALRAQGKSEEAIACYGRALQFRPDYPEAHNNLGLAWQELGELDEAAACFQRALQAKPDYAGAANNALLCQQYRHDASPARLAEVHTAWNRRWAAPLAHLVRAHANRRDPDRPLRLGFLSADFCRHPVGIFLVRTLEALRAEACSSVCYFTGSRRDDLTARFQAAAGAWREVGGLGDEALAEQVRADGIDVFFDLAGHTAGNRLLVFARKPAPLQVTWIGYEGTTGLPAMDYILADGCQIRPEEERHYCEQVLRLAGRYVCYDPPAEAPAVSPLPARVTFGSFNNPAKITPQVIETWAQVLQRLDRARLVLKYKGLDDPAVARRFAESFARQGIDPSRLEFRGWSTYDEYLADYRHIDLALDPFPFSGSATTCEALWMGVPVVTCPGATFASRHSAGHLSSIGLTQSIARDPREYVQRAVALAGDLSGLAALRARLRGQMAASPLCDGPRLARNLLALLRGAWREWCGRGY
jgi:predicted O-linked N-acetylglucosamine transferase (SPINDLY family)